MRRIIPITVLVLMLGFFVLPSTAYTTSEYVESNVKYEVNIGGAFTVKGLNEVNDTYQKIQVRFYASLDTETSEKEVILKKGQSSASGYDWALKFRRHSNQTELFEIELKSDQDVYISGSKGTGDEDFTGEEEVNFLVEEGEKKWIIDSENQIAVECQEVTESLATLQFYNHSGEKIRYKVMEVTDDLELYTFEIQLIGLELDIDSCELKAKSEIGLVTVRDWDEWGGSGIAVEEDNIIPVSISPSVPFEDEEFTISVLNPDKYDFVAFRLDLLTDEEGVELDGGYSILSKNETEIVMLFREEGSYGMKLAGEFANETILYSWKLIEIVENPEAAPPPPPASGGGQTGLLWFLLNAPGLMFFLGMVTVSVIVVLFLKVRPKKIDLKELAQMTGDEGALRELEERFWPSHPAFPIVPSAGVKVREEKKEEEHGG